MIVNKHKIMQEWVQQFLDDNHLYFQAVDADPGVRQIVPEIGDYVVKTDILGNKYKSYTFAFVGYESIDTGTSDVNTDNMYMFDQFSEWLEEQKAKGNFPDFGDKCSEYDIIILDNMANLSYIDDDGTARYMLGARIDYKEEDNA